MNVSFSLPDHLAPALQRQAAARGKNIDAFVTEVVVETLTHEEPTVVTEPSRTSFDERQAAWVQRFPVLRQPIDDSRDSFYAGRSE